MARYRDDYDYALEVLARGDESQLEELAQLMAGFPEGVDDFIGRRWIVNAIYAGSTRSIKWILAKNVDLSFRDEEGYTVLHAAIDRRSVDRIECIELLLKSGAPVNAYGINGWTPAHMAAVRDDVETLRLLRKHGADFSIRTNIDDYETPLQEARRSRCSMAVAYLQSEA